MGADPNPALQQLGRRLSLAREACGLSLEEHADRLHMGREQLQALEAGNRDGLPEPVFVIAQARRVATSLGIGIDAEIAALRSSEGFQTPRPPAPQPHSQPKAAEAPARPSLPQQRSVAAARRSVPLPVALLGVGAVLATAAGLITLRQAIPSSPSPQSPAAAPENAAPATEAASARAAEALNAPAQSGQLVLRPRAPSWLEVRSADGATLFRGMLESELRFALDAGPEVLAGRPDLVLVSLGQSPAAPMGAIEDVRWRRFSADLTPAP